MMPVKCNGCDKPCLGNCHCYDERVKALEHPGILRQLLDDRLSCVEAMA